MPMIGLIPFVAAGLVVLDRAVHHPVVGQPQRRHPQLGGALGQRHPPHVLALLVLLARAQLAGAVEQRVLAVDVKVYGGPGAH